MQNVAVSVEENLIAKRNRERGERTTTFKEEPSIIEKKLDAIINNMHSLGDRVGSVERKTSWDGQQANTIRNPNFRKNQNPNVGRAIPDHDIRPSFQEAYAEASTSSEQIKDTPSDLFFRYFAYKYHPDQCLKGWLVDNPHSRLALYFLEPL